ncbi:MAG: hypothetical protein JO313_03075 [Verrucomicrobia bacterium]|nr:hypothetical protein [Verrucomicrobiota bacterium]MBV9129559.1 hypothetical protein [Verrucomicrobiota bacterium]
MSITALTISVLLIGIVTYSLLKRLVASVRIVAACVLMVLLETFILMIENPRRAVPPASSSPTPGLAVFPARDALTVPNSTHNTGSAANVPLQRISKEDQSFLENILGKQNQDGKAVPTPVRTISKANASAKEPLLKAELAVNTTEPGRSEPVAHKETVRRAQLVTHGDTSKHAGPLQARQQ